MSLSPFDSFQSRFVTYLLNRSRIIRTAVTFDNKVELRQCWCDRLMVPQCVFQNCIATQDQCLDHTLSSLGTLSGSSATNDSGRDLTQLRCLPPYW